MQRCSIVWFRLDLRVTDNPALSAAAAHGTVLPVFIWAPQEEGPWQPGGASRWWLHQSLARLATQLKSLGSGLIVRRGSSLAELQKLVREAHADAVFWNRRYEPVVIARDRQIEKSLRSKGLRAEHFNGALLYEPWTIVNQSGKPFRVFTPFWRHCLTLPAPSKPLPVPGKLQPPPRKPASLDLSELALEPKLDWAGGLAAAWSPGEAGAAKRLRRFLHHEYADYDTRRDIPGLGATSRLSPHLHFGEISPRQVWHSLRRASRMRGMKDLAWSRSRFLAELGWREFSHHLLYHFPTTPAAPLRPEFRRFRWRTDSRHLEAWQKGQTGYPLVDAGMRELWATGWMHNRVRMIAASFLLKDLRIVWTQGAHWFWDTLVDADLAQNTLGWQWTAGCGADAAPYFRIFNPTSQGENFDPAGAYVRRWCPELRQLPDEWIHRPGATPKRILDAAGVDLGRTYPVPIVDHAVARADALIAFSKMKGSTR